MSTAAADVVVVGAGPNGLSAAVRMAAAGFRVRVYEAAGAVGGGTRTEELTLPGFLHDVCAAVLPLARGPSYLSRLPLEAHGLEWVEPPAALAHPLDDGDAIVLERSVASSAATFGRDEACYRRLAEPLAARWDLIAQDVLAPLRWPRHPAAFARFGVRALGSARSLVSRFPGAHGRALVAGLAAHTGLPLDAALTSGAALVLAITAHAVGWPFARGGTRRVSEALASYFTSLGGEIVTGRRIASLSELPPSRAVLFDVTPRQFVAIAGTRLAASERRGLGRFRYGVASFKMDWALSGPIPWSSPECARAGTVHLGGSFEEIERSESQANRGIPPSRPFVILTQPSLFDPSRAPAGAHTAWAYCHVPPGSAADMAGAIEAQIERFAPGFAGRVLARSILRPSDLARHDENLVEGHIGGGVQDWRQHFLRPSRRLYRTGIPGVYLCSASTPPGPGVHGLCGYHAAGAALADLRRHRAPCGSSAGARRDG